MNQTVLDGLKTAVFLTCAHGSVRYMNARAASFLVEQKGDLSPGPLWEKCLLPVGKIFSQLVDGVRLPEEAYAESDGRIYRWSLTELEGGNSLLFEGHDVTTERLAHQRLDKDYSQVEEQRDRLNEFVGMLSHEVKTPINVVMNALDFLSETELSPRQEEFFQIALDGARTLADTVRRSLELSRAVALDASAVRNEAPYGIRERLVEATRAIAGISERKGLQFEATVLDEVGAYYRGDWSRIKQILTILLDNAVKYTSTGGVSLTVKLVGREKESDVLEFTVADTGPGIEGQKAEVIFLPFQRASSAEEGFGLGLPIAHRLSRMVGGKLSMESLPQRGTTFSLLLPQQPCDPPLEVGEVQQRVLEGHRVLLLEDNPINLAVVTLMLERMGLSVVGRTRPLEALELAAEERFDAVVTDIGLPEMSGVEFLMRLREIPHFNSVPVIASTGAASEKERLLYNTAGFVETLEKPYSRTLLQEALTRALHRQG